MNGIDLVVCLKLCRFKKVEVRFRFVSCFVLVCTGSFRLCMLSVVLAFKVCDHSCVHMCEVYHSFGVECIIQLT